MDCRVCRIMGQEIQDYVTVYSDRLMLTPLMEDADHADDADLRCVGCSSGPSAVGLDSAGDQAFCQTAEDLTKVQNWLNRNTLTVHVDNTEYLPIYLRNEPSPGIRRLCSCVILGRLPVTAA
ncbi:hypothetical protein J6590_060122 [Homalodisca vitripennis]|nr:hypothetical protein J6590_060122 [Homalodisca vitripennis]